ncbi:lipopolysaccharide biosynthesis protein [Frigoribacterium sp. 2-23]|uniref:lipopolysaccharide biosynthesis protein n=1 Tax=Frigoribacterium sp. 2-23 TaxID=3415006 RepID=UPI003C6F1608
MKPPHEQQYESEVTVTVGPDDAITVAVATDCDHPVTVHVTTGTKTETVTVDPRRAIGPRTMDDLFAGLRHSADEEALLASAPQAAVASSVRPDGSHGQPVIRESEHPTTTGETGTGTTGAAAVAAAPAEPEPAPAAAPAEPESAPAAAPAEPARTETEPAEPEAADSSDPTPAAHHVAMVTPDERPASTGQSRLFGRGLLYVVVWSLQLVTSTVVSPVLAHLLGPGQFGSLASAIALYQVLSVVALIGLDQALVLQRAEDGDAKASRGLVAVGMVVALTVSIIAAVTVPLWSGLLGFGTDQTIVVLVILWTGPSAAVSVMLALLLAEDRFRSFAIVSALSAVGGQLVGLALLIFVHRDATTYAWGGVVSQFAAMIVGVIVTRPRLQGLVDWSITKRAMKLGLPLAVSSLAYFVLNAGDRIVLQRMEGPDAVGQYQVAYVVGSAVILMLSFTNGAWAAQFAQMRDVGERVALALRSRDELYRMLIPIVLAVTLASPLALPILAPASFRPETLTVVVFVVALTAFPVAAGGASGRLLVISRRGKTVALITGIAAVLNIGLNIALIPVVGIFGAGLATFLSYGVMAFLQRRSLPKDHQWRSAPAPLVLSIFGGVALAAASMLLPQSLEWNIARFVVAVACIPWFFVRLRQARGGAAKDPEPAAAPATPAPLDHSAIRTAAARAAALSALTASSAETAESTQPVPARPAAAGLTRPAGSAEPAEPAEPADVADSAEAAVTASPATVSLETQRSLR